MATQTKSKPAQTKSARTPSKATRAQTKPVPNYDAMESANEKVAELNEKVTANGRKAGAAVLTSYEKAVVSLADSYERAAGASKVDWFADVATLQADFTREVTKAYTGAVRELVA